MRISNSDDFLDLDLDRLDPGNSEASIHSKLLQPEAS